jgi:hypothetical protein
MHTKPTKGRNKPRQTYNDPLSSWQAIAVFGLMALVAVGAMSAPYLAERRRRKRDEWPQVRGTPTGTRTVKEPPKILFYMTIYSGECSVEYTVAETVLCLGSIRLSRPQSKWVSDHMQQCPVSRYVVHYNPEDPSDAFGERQNGPRKGSSAESAKHNRPPLPQ